MQRGKSCKEIWDTCLNKVSHLKFRHLTNSVSYYVSSSKLSHRCSMRSPVCKAQNMHGPEYEEYIQPRICGTELQPRIYMAHVCSPEYVAQYIQCRTCMVQICTSNIRSQNMHGSVHAAQHLVPRLRSQD
jgi:hypothetical protein